jgi:hypothetical protein
VSDLTFSLFHISNLDSQFCPDFLPSRSLCDTLLYPLYGYCLLGSSIMTFLGIC